MRLFTALAFLFAALIAPAFAADKPVYTFNDAFVRETPQKISAGYVVINNTTLDDDRFLGASADWAGRIELHNVTKDEKGAMVMSKTGSLTLPGGRKIMLRPGGLHLMLFDLKKPLVAGTTEKITLHFERAGDVAVPFAVKPITYRGADARDPDAPPPGTVLVNEKGEPIPEETEAEAADPHAHHH